MHLSTHETKEALKNWCNCNIMDLSKNFFGEPLLPEKSTSYEEPEAGSLLKVRSLYLDGSKLLNKLKEEEVSIKSESLFKLSFGVRELESNYLRVMPVLRVYNSQNEADCSFGFIEPKSGYNDNPKYGRGDRTSESGAFPVPQAYFDQVVKNWDESRVSQIEDAFTSNLQMGSKPRPEFSKLLGYNISSSINSNLHKMLVKYLKHSSQEHQLAFIGFHFGIDLNKVDITNAFSYVTVVEFRLKQGMDNSGGAAELFTQIHSDLLFDNTVAVNVFDSKESVTNEEEETVQVLYQYMQPCPPIGNCQE